MAKTIIRRDFLHRLSLMGAGTLAAGLMPGIAPRLVEAQTKSAKRLVVINLRGGMDHLYLLQPLLGSLADIRPNLYRADGIAVPGKNLSWHPSLSEFASLYTAGDLAVCHKVRYENISLSHEDAEQTYARGVADRKSAQSSGWLNRLGQVFFSSHFDIVNVMGGTTLLKVALESTPL